MGIPSYPQLNWRASGTTSDAIGLAGQTVVGFFTPHVFASSTVTFTGCDTIDGTYKAIKDSGGSAISFSVGIDGYYGFKYDQIGAFLGLQFIKMVGGSSEAAATQVKLACRELD
jgi:hypothetical protein